LRDVNNATPLLALDAVALDTETTGLDARAARLVQLGALRIRDGALDPADRFERLVNPSGRIPAGATAVHGITDAMVADAPRFAEVAGDLEAFLGRSIIVGHAVHYDLAVLEREYRLAGRDPPRLRALDVRSLARLAAPTLADHGLEGLCGWLGITLQGRHTAMGDAEAAGRIFAALIPLLREKSIRTLAEAQAATRSLAEREAHTAGGFVPEGPRPRDGADVFARLESFPFRHVVRDVMSAPPLFAPPQTSIREAARLIIERRMSSVFVRAAGGATGIVTERDMLRALDASGEAAFATPIVEIMSSPLQTVADDAYLYQAIGRLERLGIRHLGVRDAQGEIVGAVTTRNLLHHRASTALMLGDEIESAATDAALGAAWSKLPRVARNLLDEAVDPRTISTIISSEIRNMTKRAAELAEARLRGRGIEPPGVAFALLVLGSAGRGESQLAADQDNAIVFAEGEPGGPADLYFEKLAADMNAILDAAGIPLCKGGVMARNQEWRKSAAAWQATIEGWVRRQRPQDMLNVDIFFDALPVHGTTGLGDAIWNHAYDRGHAARAFQNILIETARRRGRPLTLLGNFRLDERGRIDLKRHGLMPIFAAARVLSIRHDVRARSTAERLEGAAAKGIGSPSTVRGIIEAHRVILGAIFAQQIADTEAGIPVSGRVAPGRLDKAARAELKHALAMVEEAVGLAAEGRL
jgi:DNA polymerase-3 subunit epsilon/CBS domain-containing protein